MAPIKKKHFSINETSGLISVWRDVINQNEFSRFTRHSVIFQKISDELKKLGYIRSGVEVKNKIKNLKCDYKKYKPKSGEHGPINCNKLN